MKVYVVMEERSDWVFGFSSKIYYEVPVRVFDTAEAAGEYFKTHGCKSVKEVPFGPEEA